MFSTRRFKQSVKGIILKLLTGAYDTAIEVDRLLGIIVNLSDVTDDNMKRLGFRATFLSTEEKADARTKALQTTEPQLFYIVC